MGLKVALLGYGAIGREVRRMLQTEGPGIELLGAITRGGPIGSGTGHADGKFPVLGLAEAIDRADLIVECASGQAIRDHGPVIIGSGTDLLIASLGALADPALRETLLKGGPGRSHLSTGAIGGLDLLRAASIGGGLDHAMLTTSKSPRSLITPEMHPGTARTLENTTAPFDLFRGGVHDAVRKFPRNINVAAALALAVGSFNMVSVRLVADPDAVLTRHVIEASGPAGEYRFEISNAPDADNPATSGLTARAIAAGIRRLAGIDTGFV